MRTINLKSTVLPCRRFSWIPALGFALLLIGHALSSQTLEAQTPPTRMSEPQGQTQGSQTQGSQIKTFSSPAEASAALFQAVQKEDEQALEAILGAGKEVTSSGDDLDDKLEREQFSRKYQEMHRLVREPDGRTVLYIGSENWPFSVPLMSKNGAWYFDSDGGRQEIRFRRIGENEATAIQVCGEFAAATSAAGAKDTGANDTSEDPILQFAAKLVLASAANAGNKESNPFHGYYFRIVTPDSPSGAGGKGSTRDLMLVAYPAEYRQSGVMTFVVTRHGTVYESEGKRKKGKVKRESEKDETY